MPLRMFRRLEREKYMDVEIRLREKRMGALNAVMNAAQ